MKKITQRSDWLWKLKTKTLTFWEFVKAELSLIVGLVTLWIFFTLCGWMFLMLLLECLLVHSPGHECGPESSVSGVCSKISLSLSPLFDLKWDSLVAPTSNKRKIIIEKQNEKLAQNQRVTKIDQNVPLR